MNKILVTGAGGFIGSHLTELLVNKGFNVKAFVHYNSKNIWGWLEKSEIKDDIEVVTGDIRDYDSVYNAHKECGTVFHLAALIGIPYSYISPKAYIETNITGTYNVLQASKDLNIEQVLITSTSETYGTAQYVPIDEKHQIVGQSPYSASKISADQIAVSYYRSFKTPVKIVRPFNTYGPRQSARAIIPTIISQITNGESELRLGNLNPTRDLTYVTDTANGFYEIYKSDKTLGEVINIGNNKEISVGDLVNLIGSIMNVTIKVKQNEQRIRPENSEVERLMCDNSRILSKTDWKPLVSLKEGLTNSIKWIKDNINQFKSSIYNV